MINRALLRIKVVQILYAYFKTEKMTVAAAEKELDKSISQTYDLYLYMLSLIPSMARYVELDIDNRRNKFLPTDEDRNPNTRFADNILAQQLAESEKIKDFESRISYAWYQYDLVLKALYERISDKPYFAEYMTADVRSYSDDKDIWRRIFKFDVPESLALDAHLEEISVYWNDDLETVASFVQKTVKHFKINSNPDDEILPMYHSIEDSEFVHQLFRAVIKNSDKYDKLIDETTKNWELERIAFMDTLIMKVALAEIFTFPTIPVSVTLNEFIEIAKSYSTPRSAPFINGVLDRIVSDQKRQGKLMKADTIEKTETNEE